MVEIPETPPGYLPTNQSEDAHTPCHPSPKICLKNSSLNTIREFGSFEHEPPVLLAWPCNKPFSAPNSEVSVWLHHASGTWTWVWPWISQHVNCNSVMLLFKILMISTYVLIVVRWRQSVKYLFTSWNVLESPRDRECFSFLNSVGKLNPETNSPQALAEDTNIWKR